MPYMYILECADGSYYTRSTKELERRLWEHQNGLGANHTAKRLPVKLVYFEECDRIDGAFYREKQVQGWSRKKKEALMTSDTNQLHLLAECKNESHCSGATASASLNSSPLAGHVGFDSAQPTGTVAVQTRDNLARSLSGVEGNNAQSDNLARSLSGVETNIEGIVE